MKGFVFNLGKSYFIITIALGVAAGGSFGLRTLTDTLTNGISQIMTGDNDVGSKCLLQNATVILGCKIDQNIVSTQSMMQALDSMDTADDDFLEDKITQAKWFTGIGTAGPAVVAGTMLIVFRIAMALFIGFAPIFILCLLFKRTAPLFQKWLYYGLATIFSGVMLGVMSDIAMDLVANVAVSATAVDLTSMVLTGKSGSGIMQTVTQQLGLGLMLSTLLITVPPMAGMFFNGVMGSFAPYSSFERWNNPNGAVPPHVDGGASAQQINRTTQNIESAPANGGSNHTPNYVNNSQNINLSNGTQLGNATKPSTGRPTYLGNAQSDSPKPSKGKEE